MRLKTKWKKKKKKVFPVAFGLLFLGCTSTQFTASPVQEIDTFAVQTVTGNAILIETATSEILETSIPVLTPMATLTSTALPASTNIPTELPTPSFVQIDNGTEENIDIASLIDSNNIFEEGDIKIYKPGNYSLVSSPFRITADAIPDDKSQIQVRLVGEDGRTLAQKKLYVTVLSGNTAALFSTELEFEIETIAEAGRVEISAEDEFGRLRSLNSVDVILMSVGLSDYNYSGEYYSEIIIQQPHPNMYIEGDTLIVSGIAKANTEKPIQLEVLDEAGILIGTGEATLVIPSDSLHGIFVGNINYRLTEPTSIRLLLKIPGARIPGIAFVKSVELIIGP